MIAVLADPVFDKDDERLTSSSVSASLQPYALKAGRREPDGGAVDEVSMGTARKALRAFGELGEGEAAGIARLPFSRREAEAIMALAPAEGGMLALGFRASRATVTSPELSEYRVVHIAAHGLLNSAHPELSGIVLSLFDETGRRQNGFLQHTRFTTSICPPTSSSSPPVRRRSARMSAARGLVGLTRGFMYAGAPRVVASLWKVDDAATAELMGEFYGAMLGGGLRPAAASARRAASHVATGTLAVAILLGRLHPARRVEVKAVRSQRGPRLLRKKHVPPSLKAFLSTRNRRELAVERALRFTLRAPSCSRRTTDIQFSDGAFQHVESPTSLKKEWVLTREAFDRLLAMFDADREQAGRMYECIRCKLVKYFQWRGAGAPDREADETINRVARRIEEGESISNLNAYFYGVARLVLAESLRAREREREALQHVPVVEPPPTDDDSDADGRRACFDRCLRHLSDESRDLIIEYYNDEKSGKIERRKHLAARLGIQLNALRIRAHRIRINLEACVRECLVMHT